MTDIIVWLWHHSYGQKLRIALACLFGILRVTIGLGFVWISKLLVDAAMDKEIADTEIVRLSIILVSLLLVEMAFSFVSQYFSTQTETRMKNNMRRKIYSNLLQSRWDKMEGMHSGDLLNRITEDVRVVGDVVCKNSPNMLVMLIQFAAAFVMLYAMSWQLAIIVICIIPFFFIVSRAYVKKTRVITNDIRKSDSQIHTNIQEGLQHHAVVQTLECGSVMENTLNQLQGTLYGQTLHRLRFGIFSHSMLRLGFIACYATAFIWSAWHLRTGLMTYGMMTAFLQLVSRIQMPIVGMAQLVPSFVQALSSVDRLKELEILPAEEKDESILLKSPIGIRVTDLSFHYETSESNVYTHFSHDFKPGSKTTLMGETGAGKSTLVKILLALVYPQEGKVFLYDKEKEVRVSPMTRCNMVYVPQGNSLLVGTIRSNLLLGNPEATEEMMQQALHTAVADFVYTLPEGLDSRCGELGCGLSEGQAQRIAIARALLRKGNLLLLDEFNSSLDQTTASMLMQRLLENNKDKTIIFISHRPEVADYCDECLKI